MSRRWQLRIALAFVSLTIALALGEWCFRSLRPDSSAYTVEATGNQYRFYQFDPRLGWANAPGARGTFQRDEFTYEVAINRHGMRQGELTTARVDGQQRIAVLGDSFVWGIGVADADRFTELLAARLAATEVLNFGVSGYGLVQHLLSLDHVLAFEPDLVLVTFCLGNDFVDDVQSVRYGYPKPFARIDAAGDLEIVDGEFAPDATFGFTARPRLLGSELLGAVLQQLAPPHATSTPRGLTLLTEQAMYDDTAAGELRAQRELAFATNRLLLRAIRDRVAAAGKRLLITSAPTKFEYNRRGETGHEGVFPRLEQALQSACSSLAIDFVPMVAELTGEDFWQRDGHWNLAGHRKVAAALANALQSRGFATR